MHLGISETEVFGCHFWPNLSFTETKDNSKHEHEFGLFDIAHDHNLI